MAVTLYRAAGALGSFEIIIFQMQFLHIELLCPPASASRGRANETIKVGDKVRVVIAVVTTYIQLDM